MPNYSALFPPGTYHLEILFGNTWNTGIANTLTGRRALISVITRCRFSPYAYCEIIVQTPNVSGFFLRLFRHILNYSPDNIFFFLWVVSRVSISEYVGSRGHRAEYGLSIRPAGEP